jgi:hypothetical protein
MKLEFFRQMLEKKFQISSFIKIRPLGSRVVSCGQMDMTKLIVAFRNFAKAPINANPYYTARGFTSLTFFVLGKKQIQNNTSTSGFTTVLNRDVVCFLWHSINSPVTQYPSFTSSDLASTNENTCRFWLLPTLLHHLLPSAVEASSYAVQCRWLVPDAKWPNINFWPLTVHVKKARNFRSTSCQVFLHDA